MSSPVAQDPVPGEIVKLLPYTLGHAYWLASKTNASGLMQDSMPYCACRHHSRPMDPLAHCAWVDLPRSVHQGVLADIGNHVE